MRARAHIYLPEDIEVRQNLHLVTRERGKVVDRRDGHNIFLDTGRQWLAELIAFISFGPDTPQRNDRIKYMGLGIGGTRQLAQTFADAPPLDIYIPTAGFTQTDLDPTVADIERPVRVVGASGPFQPTDEWIGQIAAPPAWPVPESVTFFRVFGQLEVSYVPYDSVPLSEIGLFTASANINSRTNTGLMVAYDTFDTLSKTSSVELEVRWTIKF